MVARGEDRVNFHAGTGAGTSLPALASQPLFCAVARYCTNLAGDAFPGVDLLNAALGGSALRPCNVAGQPIRFVAQDSNSLSYEARVYRRGEVETRPNNWHDLFNALVWMTFPRTKAELNALHVERMDDLAPGGRGPSRDAATQFDESGIVVLSADAELLDLLARRCWKPLFWDRRAEVIARMRFLVFGHGLYDALRAPFYQMCGRAALIEVTDEIIASDVAAQCEHADRVLAQRFTRGDWYPRPRTLMALPLLGIPGVAVASECAAYYEDADQFRPPPDWATT